MPLSPTEEWDLLPEILQANNKRLGNMALLNPEANVGGGNKSFAEKLPIYKASPLLLTQAIATHTTWGPGEIDARQAQMAEIAPSVWVL